VSRISSASSRLRSPAEILPAGAQQHRVALVDLREQHPDDLALRRGQILADVVRANRQLPVPPVDEDGQLDGARAADVAEGVQRRPDGTAGVEDVVDQDHDLVVDARGRDLGMAQCPGRPQPQVIPVHGDVERAGRNLAALHLGQPLCKPPRERHPSGRDAEQNHVAGAVGALQDLVRDPGQRPPYLVGLQHRLGGWSAQPIGRMHQGTPFPASPDGA